MAAATPRILYQNLLLQAGVVLVPSDEATGQPRAALLRPHPSDVWRTLTGAWHVGTVENDRVDFDRSGSGPFVATLTGGNYATAALKAAEIQTRMNAVDSGWTVSYSSGTKKFTFANADVTSELLFGTGANLVRSVAPDLGFDVVDRTGSSIEGDDPVYHSRHWMNFDLGSAQAFTAVVMIGHNVTGTGAAARLDGDDATMVGVGLGATVDFTSAIDLDGDVTYFAQQTRRYLRLVIYDIQNTDAYSEVGVLFVGPYLGLEGFAPQVVDVTDDLSEVTKAVGGAPWATVRAQPRTWELRLINVTNAAKAELRTFEETVGTHSPWFFNFDSADPSNTRYVRMTTGFRWEAQETTPVTWHASVRFEEYLG